MLFRVDPLSSQPIFEQIVHAVKGCVARGELSQGDKLPSVRELARGASINPNTVVRAYEVLERDGVIVRRQGAGSFVSAEGRSLRDDARERELANLAELTVTEAFHLGFDAAEVRRALDAALKRIQFPKGTRNAPKSKRGRP